MFPMYQPQDKHLWPDYIFHNGRKCSCVYQDRIELEIEARENKKVQQILYNTRFSKERWFYDGQIYEDFAIPALFWKIVNYDGMGVIHYMGPSNGGKSYLAAAHAHELLEYWLNYRGIKGNYYYYFSYARAIDEMSKHKKGDSVIIDEMSKRLGQDSAAAAIRFSNTLRASRKRGVSYFICDPEEQNVPNCQYMLRTAFYVEEMMMTRCLLYTGKTRRLDGLSDWIVPLNDPWFKDMMDEYERQKDAYLKGFAERGGAAESGLKTKQDVISEALWIMTKNRGMPEGKRGWKSRLMTYLTDLGYDHETFNTRDQVCEKLVMHLEKIYDADTKMFDFSIEFDPNNYDYSDRLPEPGPEPEEVEEDFEIDASSDRKEQIFETLAKKYRVDERSIDMTRRYCSGQTQDKIADALGVSQPTISNGFKEVSNYIGYAFEDFYSARLELEGVPHIHNGGNTPEPDIIVLDENNKPKAVYSLKCYITANNRSSTVIDRNELAASELEMRSQGVPLYLVFYDIVEDKIFEPLLVEEQFTFSFKREKKHEKRPVMKRQEPKPVPKEPDIKTLDKGKKDTAAFFEALIYIASTLGLDEAEKTMREKGLKEVTIRASMNYIRQELDRRGIAK